jgi:hypothetical protein
VKFSGKDTVQDELDKFKQGCVGANVAWAANPVATDGDMGAIRVIFLRANLLRRQPWCGRSPCVCGTGCLGS